MRAYLSGTPELIFTRLALKKIAQIKSMFINIKIIFILKIEVSPETCPVPASLLKVNKNQNDFIKPLFGPKSNVIIVRISALLYKWQESLQKLHCFLVQTVPS